MKYNRYLKRDAIRDYFPLPNEIFCRGLSSGEIAVYAYLLYGKPQGLSVPSQLQDHRQCIEYVP